MQQPEPHRHADHDHRRDVHRAREHEDQHRAPRDHHPGDALTAEHPRAQREPAETARGDDRVDRELRQREQLREPTAQRVEGEFEQHHVADAREQLEADPRRDPAEVRIGHALARRAQPRHSREQSNDERAEDREAYDTRAQPPRRSRERAFALSLLSVSGWLPLRVLLQLRVRRLLRVQRLLRVPLPLRRRLPVFPS